MDLVIGMYDETPNVIAMETSRNKPIKNAQHTILCKQEVETELREGKKYNSEFQGEATKIYNCHGLTFACRRSGIFDDDAIQQILNDEYIEIKERDRVNVGDVVLYIHTTEKYFLHSGIVVEAKKPEPLSMKQIKVISKTRAYKEIVHNVQEHPFVTCEFKFYRINHGTATIIQ